MKKIELYAKREQKVYETFIEKCGGESDKEKKYAYNLIMAESKSADELIKYVEKAVKETINYKQLAEITLMIKLIFNDKKERENYDNCPTYFQLLGYCAREYQKIYADDKEALEYYEKMLIW